MAERVRLMALGVVVVVVVVVGADDFFILLVGVSCVKLCFVFCDGVSWNFWNLLAEK